MEIGKMFNQFSLKEYIYSIDNYKKLNDFNTLGLYRSIIENDKLTLNEKIIVRELAHKIFKKAFEFLQLKDPDIYVKVSTLGEEFTKGDEENIWRQIIINQQKILSDKKIKHRNFGTYAKHNCPNQDCVWNGVMIKQGSWLAERNMHFLSDKGRYELKLKSSKRRQDRKNEKRLISEHIER